MAASCARSAPALGAPAAQNSALPAAQRALPGFGQGSFRVPDGTQLFPKLRARWLTVHTCLFTKTGEGAGERLEIA